MVRNGWFHGHTKNIAFVLVLLLTREVSAGTIVSYHFEGEVTEYRILGPPLVTTGDRFRGDFFYPLESTDYDDRPESGDYGFDIQLSPPAGMSFRAGNFEHVPRQGIQIFVENRTQTGDSFTFESFTNFAFGPEVVQLKIMDPTGRAFTSDRLPPQLDLADFASAELIGVVVNQSFGYFRGRIDTLYAVPEPQTLLLLGIVLVSQRRRLFIPRIS